MVELLTSLDVVNQSFKKSMRGYDSAEVDEFLDNVQRRFRRMRKGQRIWSATWF